MYSVLSLLWVIIHLSLLFKQFDKAVCFQKLTQIWRCDLKETTAVSFAFTVKILISSKYVQK